MRIDRRKVLSFVAWFVPICVGMFVLYPTIMRFYEPAVFGAANSVMRRLEPPTELARADAGGWATAIDTGRGYRRIYQTWPAGVKHLHFLSIALLPALLLATPAPWRTRLLLLAIGIPLLFAAHTIAMIGITRTAHCYTEDEFNVACRIMMRIANTSGQLFCAALWALLTFRYWVDRTPSPPARGLEP